MEVQGGCINGLMAGEAGLSMQLCVRSGGGLWRQGTQGAVVTPSGWEGEACLTRRGGLERPPGLCVPRALRTTPGTALQGLAPQTESSPISRRKIPAPTRGGASLGWADPLLPWGRGPETPKTGRKRDGIWVFLELYLLFMSP